MSKKAHWESVFRTRQPAEVSWYQPHLATSLALIAKTGLGPGGCLLDVGGGASTLVDDLLARGDPRLTVLDVSGEALRAAQARLGARAEEVTWIEADILQAQLSAGSYDLWHDRALFHFLTDPPERQAYLAQLRHSLKPRGHVILATFSLEAPPKCSGLDVRRYSPTMLEAELGEEFRLMETVSEEHRTPRGAVQAFLYAWFVRRDGDVP